MELVVSWAERTSAPPTGTGAPGTTSDGAGDDAVAGVGELALRAAGVEPAGPPVPEPDPDPDPDPVEDGSEGTPAPEPDRAPVVAGGDPVGRTLWLAAVVGGLFGAVVVGGAAVVVVTGCVVVVVGAAEVVVDGRVVLVARGAVVAVGAGAVVAVVPVEPEPPDP